MKKIFYLCNLDYGERTNYLPFLNELCVAYDCKSLIGTTFFIKNDPYDLQLKIVLVLKNEAIDFDQWMNNNYSEISYHSLYNNSINEIIKKNFNDQSYIMYTFKSVSEINAKLCKRKNELFLFPEKKYIQPLKINCSSAGLKVFLSHSSKDKALIDIIYNKLVYDHISIWYDKFEIDYGDSITDKINIGLVESDLGLLCISKSFLKSKWATSELNYFIQKNMYSKERNFIILNLDCEHSKLPPLVQDNKYLDFINSNWQEELFKIFNKLRLKKFI